MLSSVSIGIYALSGEDGMQLWEIVQKNSFVLLI